MLVDFIERQFHPAADLDSRMGLLAWQSGEVLWGDLAVRGSLSSRGSAGEAAAGPASTPTTSCGVSQTSRSGGWSRVLQGPGDPAATEGIGIEHELEAGRTGRNLEVTKPRLVVPPVTHPLGDFRSFTQGESGNCAFDESRSLN